MKLAVLLLAAGCSHVELTGDEHRKAAADARASATKAESYEPTAKQKAEADRQMALSFRHLRAARGLEGFEDDACFGLAEPVRVSCPVLAPHLESVEELANGVALHFEDAHVARTVGIQMRCHLAYAMANNFERAPCPLYLKGVQIQIGSEREIVVGSRDAEIAREVKAAARRMFGGPEDSKLQP